MKFYFSALIALTLMSCKSLESLENKPDCPKGYECKTEVVTNTSILVLEDSIGKNYIKMMDSEDYNVVKYTYLYKGRPEIADDTYSEAIYFQVPKKENKMELTDKTLSNLNLIVQKLCFCPDAGYELVKEGHLKIEKHKNTYNIKLDFKTEKNMRLNGLQASVGF